VILSLGRQPEHTPAALAVPYHPDRVCCAGRPV